MKSGHRLKKPRLSEKKLRTHIARFIASFGNTETKGTYDRCLREFVRWFGGRRDFRFRIEDIQRYKRYLTKKKKLSDVSVSTYLTALRRFLAFLVEHKVLTVNPAKFVDGNSRPRVHSRSVLSETDVQRLLDVLRSDDEIGLRDTAIILMMLDCGLSGAELVHANAGDLAGGSLLVQGKGRTSKDASVVLTPRALEALRRYREACVKLNGGNVSPESPLLVSAGNRTRGQRMSTRGIRETVNNYLTAAGIKNEQRENITPHSLRHTAARRMAGAGATAEEIQQRLRIGTVATANLYMQE